MTVTGTDSRIATGLGAAADGIGTLEAAVMLLTGSSSWLELEDFTSRFSIEGTGGDGTHRLASRH